jgi:DNA repair protein RadD
MPLHVESTKKVSLWSFIVQDRYLPPTEASIKSMMLSLEKLGQLAPILARWSNYGLISEGLDVPTVSAAILLRPTKGLALYLQQVGRALRPAPGKERALILDHAGVTFRFGARTWSLAGKEKSDPPPMQRCPECGALVLLADWTCPECGAVLREPAAPRSYVEIEGGRLIEVEDQWLAAARYGEALAWAGDDEHRLHRVARARGYKRGWVWHRMQEVDGEPS